MPLKSVGTQATFAPNGKQEMFPKSDRAYIGGEPVLNHHQLKTRGNFNPNENGICRQVSRFVGDGFQSRELPAEIRNVNGDELVSNPKKGESYRKASNQSAIKTGEKQLSEDQKAKLREELIRITVKDSVNELKRFSETNKIPIDWKDKASNTPLIYATVFGSTECIRYLVEKGADPLLYNENFETALSIAIRNTNEKAIKRFLSTSSAKSCLKEIVISGFDGKRLPDLLLDLYEATVKSTDSIIKTIHDEAENACEMLGIETW